MTYAEEIAIVREIHAHLPFAHFMESTRRIIPTSELIPDKSRS